MSPPPTLLTLPRELRDEIYGYLLTGEPTTSNRDAFVRRKFHTGILGVNKQVHQESEKFLLENHSFILLHYVGNQKSFEHEAFAPFLNYRIPIVSRGLQTTKPSPCTRLQLGLQLKCLDPLFGNADEVPGEQDSMYSYLVCSSDFEIVSRITQWSFPWIELDAVFVTSSAPATLWIREAGRESRSQSGEHALICTDVGFFDQSMHHMRRTSRQELITNTCRFICDPDKFTISGLESAERTTVERRMTTKVFSTTKMMADLLKTAQYLKSRADYLSAQDDTEGAECYYAAFLQSFYRSIKPLRSSIKAEVLYQDPTCAEYIHGIVELALNVQMTVINGDLLTYSESAAVRILSNFCTDRHVTFPDAILKDILPRVDDEIKYTLANALHLHALLGYPRFVGLHRVVESLELCLMAFPNDERLSYDLNLTKELQARAHVSPLSLRFRNLSDLF